MLIQEPTTTRRSAATHVKRSTARRNARFGASIEKLEDRQLFSAGSLATATPAYRFVTLDSTSGYPTLLYGINNNGIASGLVTNPTTGDSTGIVFKNDVGKKIVLTGALDTETYQINDAGKIAVSFFGGAKVYHAAVYDSVHHTAVILPDVKGGAKTSPAASTTVDWSSAIHSPTPASRVASAGPIRTANTRSSPHPAAMRPMAEPPLIQSMTRARSSAMSSTTRARSTAS